MADNTVTSMSEFLAKRANEREQKVKEADAPPPRTLYDDIYEISDLDGVKRVLSLMWDEIQMNKRPPKSFA